MENTYCLCLTGQNIDNMAWAIQVVSELSSNISTVEGLERFQYKDKNNKDWGLNVRQRAKELRSLISNPELIKRERQKVIHGVH